MYMQYGSATDSSISATHDVSRVSYHVKHLESFAEALQEVRYLALLALHTSLDLVMSSYISTSP